MILSVPISVQAEEQLRRHALDAGVSPDMLAARLLERTLARIPDLSAISGPIGERFRKSGMTEDELSELLEAEKHSMRSEKRAKAQDRGM